MINTIITRNQINVRIHVYMNNNNNGKKEEKSNNSSNAHKIAIVEYGEMENEMKERLKYD